MAKTPWSDNPNWTPLSDINKGNQLTPADGLYASDMNKVILNLQYLYQREYGCDFDSQGTYPNLAAGKATADGDGNIIATTYVPKMVGVEDTFSSIQYRNSDSAILLMTKVDDGVVNTIEVTQGENITIRSTDTASEGSKPTSVVSINPHGVYVDGQEVAVLQDIPTIIYGDIITKADVENFDNYSDRLYGSHKGYNIYFQAAPEDNGGVGEIIPLTYDVFGDSTYFVGKHYTHRIWHDALSDEWKYESYPKERAETAQSIYMLDYSEKINPGSYAGDVPLTSDMFLPPIDINQFDNIYAITNVGQVVKCAAMYEETDDGTYRTGDWIIHHVRNMGLTAETISVDTIKTNNASEITFSSTTAFDKNVHINAGKKLYVETVSAEPTSRGGAGTITATSSTTFNSNVIMQKTLRAKADIRVGENEQIKLKHDGAVGYITINDNLGNTMFEVTSDTTDFSTSVSLYAPGYNSDGSYVNTSYKELYLDSKNLSINGLAKITNCKADRFDTPYGLLDINASIRFTGPTFTGTFDHTTHNCIYFGDGDNWITANNDRLHFSALDPLDVEEIHSYSPEGLTLYDVNTIIYK